MNLVEAKTLLRSFNTHQSMIKPFNPDFRLGNKGWANTATRNVAVSLTYPRTRVSRLNQYLEQITPSERETYALKMIARRVIGKRTKSGTSLDSPSIDWEQINLRVHPHHIRLHDR